MSSKSKKNPVEVFTKQIKTVVVKMNDDQEIALQQISELDAVMYSYGVNKYISKQIH